MLYYDDGKILEKAISFSDKKLDTTLDIDKIFQKMTSKIPKYKIEELFDNKFTQEVIKEYLAALIPFSYFSSLQKMALEAKKFIH